MTSKAKPHAEERKDNPIDNLDNLLEEAKVLLNVHNDQYENSIRHTVVKEALVKAFPDRGITSLPLAVQRRTDNPDYVTWTGTHQVLKRALQEPKRFKILDETRFTRLIPDDTRPDLVRGAQIRDLRSNSDKVVKARVRFFFISMLTMSC